MSETIKRTSEIEEFTNLYLIHPVSSWLVPRFAALKVTPNMVSLSGMLAGFLAGFAYYNYQDGRLAILGFALMLTWHILDGADGQLARLTQTQSELGKVIDGICDYVVFISVYIALGLTLAPDLGSWVWALVILAGAAHAVQAGAYETQRQEYDFWGHGKLSARLPEPDELQKGLNGGPFGAIAGKLEYGYVKMQYAFSGVDSAQRHEIQHLLDKNPELAGEIRAIYRLVFSRSVKLWSVMCANYRTFAIFIACIIGEPVVYFLFELVVLNVVLMALVHKQKKYNRLFIRQLRELTSE
ncbi:CDP-alcohol phosphatidyltransferase family protein [Emcibacter nanhaiensis]|uniref:CDP-alcohol phosphatidyltransferase family protein n=1 Tax=Emcibacter nanhaiensis TaxID=1505037 RepID=A0A501PC11_9PROT|nr:CDP-alcohol phosphatidyltransferase family protein [Emcibacter nanhaiensis]TPD57552.1 CDP-alcohol phosphatidyltransferase family protein [Emcibacter nanhaiensis]